VEKGFIRVCANCGSDNWYFDIKTHAVSNYIICRDCDFHGMLIEVEKDSQEEIKKSLAEEKQNAVHLPKLDSGQGQVFFALLVLGFALLLLYFFSKEDIVLFFIVIWILLEVVSLIFMIFSKN